MINLWRILLRCLLVAGPIGGASLVHSAATLPVGPTALSTLTEAPPSSGREKMLPLPGPFQLAAVSSFADMVERPVFSPTRRPFVPDPPPSASPPSATVAPPPELHAVVKAIVFAQSGRMTLVGRTGQKGVQLLTEGDELDGWTVSAIDRNAVLFRLGAQELQLFAAPPVQGAVTWEAADDHTSAP